MGTRRRLATLALLLTLVSGLVAVAHAEVVQSGNLRVAFHADFAPKTLPRDRPAPITVEVEGKISTTDGTHPPAMQRLQIELNRAGQIDPEGLPVCSQAALQSTDTEAAHERCGAAQVGDGSFEAQLELSGKPFDVKGQALVFNSLIGKRPAMLIHVYIASPVRLALVIPLKIGRGKGEFGTVLSARVPPLASGYGSITELSLRIGRNFGSGGARHSYLSASCAAPKGFPGASFTFARGKFSFAGGKTLHAALIQNCKVRNR